MSDEPSKAGGLLLPHSAESAPQLSYARPRPSPLTSGQIAVPLGLACGILVVLIVAVGDLGLRRVDQINAGLQDVVDIQWTKLRLSREMVTYSDRNIRIAMQVFLLKDEAQINALLATRKENSGRISALLAELDVLSQTAEEQRLLNDIKNRRKIYVESYQQALHLLRDEKKYDAAAAIIVKQTNPAWLRYADARDLFARFQGDELQLATQQTTVRDTAARRLTLAIVAFAALLAGAIALFVTKRTVRETAARLAFQQAAMRRAHQEAEVFINTVPSILIGMDYNAQITRWNSTAASAFGLSKADVVGKRLADCGVKWLKPDMHQEILSWCGEQKCRRSDRVPFEINGETRLLGLTITPVRVANEPSKELLVIGSDITRRSAMEVQLQQAQKLESVGQLAAGIAHEINTPAQYIGDNVRFLKNAFQELRGLLAHYEGLLAAAQGNTLSGQTVQEVTAAVALADSVYLLEEIPKAIEQAIEGVTRVSTLVGAMKEFSHPDTKQKIPLDLNHAIQSTITVARNEWKYVAEMETEFDPSLPLISCQPGEFNQVILNLIINAAHAIAGVLGNSASKRGKIKVQTQNTEQWAEIRIQDTGTGIPLNVQSRIFDPFFTTKEIGKGTGQGLAIARSVVVDKHGGTIHFVTEEGSGTTFIIRLPHDGEALAAKAVSA